MKNFLIEAREFAYNEIEKTGMPLKTHVDLSCSVGSRLAKELGANAYIVEAGTLLMDCVIGQAIQQGKIEEHIPMSLDRANKLLTQSSLSNEEKENIRHCITEHHGERKFYSLESEICCNADCYRFTSVEGFMYAVRYMRDMPFPNLITLLEKKVDEKWNALSLYNCKRELMEDHEILKKLLVGFKLEN